MPKQAVKYWCLFIGIIGLILFNKWIPVYANPLQYSNSIKFKPRSSQIESIQNLNNSIDWVIALSDDIISHNPNPGNFQWDWSEGVMMQGIWKAFEKTENPIYFNYVQNYVNTYVDAFGNITAHIDDTAYVNHVGPASLLLDLFEQTHQAKYLTAAQTVANYVMNDVPRATNGAMAHYKSDQIWIDTLYMVGKFLIRMAEVTGDAQYLNLITDQILLHKNQLWDEQAHLFYHGWDEDGSAAWTDPATRCSPEFWARGNGWAFCIMADLLTVLPTDHPQRADIETLFREQANALSFFQDDSTGLWFTVVDKADSAGNYIETSASALFTYGLQKGLSNACLDTSYRSSAQFANTGLNAKISLDGENVVVDGISKGTAVGDYNYYVSIKYGNNEPWRMGPILFAKSIFRPDADLINPIISNVHTTNITFNSAQISWETHEPSDSQIEYGLNATYDHVSSYDQTNNTTHTMVVAELDPLTTYHYRVLSRDSSGNLGLSEDRIFTTEDQTVLPGTFEYSLNGIWDFTPVGLSKTTLEVPGFYVWKKSPKSTLLFPDEITGPWKIFEGYPEAIYEHPLSLSNSLWGKHIFLHFDAVNFVADFYINDQFVTRHCGGYVPFEIDITDFVQAPSENTLKVKIVYNDPDFVDGKGKPLWPVGFYGNYWELGIAGDASLIAREPVYVENIYIQTDVDNQLIRAEIAIANADSIAQQVDLTTLVKDEGTPLFSWNRPQLDIPALDTVVISLEKTWTDPQIWWWDAPYLYDFVAILLQEGQQIQAKSERFGFREFGIKNGRFSLNGVQTNLRGDNIVLYGEKQYWKYLTPSPENWSTILDSMIALNFNVIRINENPPPKWMHDLCDEKGMMVIAESAIMYRNEVVPYQSAIYAANGIKWQKDWVRQYRNHASTVIWAAENEMYYYGNLRCSVPQIISFDGVIQSQDTTRPVIFEGDFDLNGYADIMSYHYIYRYPAGWPDGSIYLLAEHVHPTKPSSFGEFEWWARYTTPIQTLIRRQCIKSRAARVVGFSDIRPFRLDWAWHPNPEYIKIYDPVWTPSKSEKEFLRDSFDPVAIFDKAFWEYHKEPWTPVVNENETITRQVVLFNDEHEGTEIEVRWRTTVEDEERASGSFSETIPLGTNKERSLVFKAPFVAYDRVFLLELSTYKNGILKFSETYPFWVNNIGIAPPRAVENINIQRSGSQIQVSWSPVTQDVDGNPESIAHYRLYRSTNCFQSSSIDSFTIQNQTSYLDQTAGYAQDTTYNIFYRMRAVDQTQLRSKYSVNIGEVDYPVKTSSGTDFNFIGLPLEISGIESASALMAAIPGCNGIAQWDVVNQGFEQYIPDYNLNNFSIEAGHAYFANVTFDTTFSFIGTQEPVSYDLIASGETTHFNDILIPLERVDLMLASELLVDITSCNSVATWSPQIQGYLQYDPALPESDFAVQPGYAYLIHITKNSIWPQSNSGTRLVSSKVLDYLPSDEMRSQAPHLIYGQIPDLQKGAPPAHFKAFILSKPDEIITADSPGCKLSESEWSVQCASFPNGWRKGETVQVELTDSQDRVQFYEVILSWNPSDEAFLKHIEESSHQPLTTRLYANYPNPFNPSTRIPYEIESSSHVRIRILDITGRVVRRLLEQELNAGKYEIVWDSIDYKGDPVSSGVYLIDLSTPVHACRQKILLIR